MDGDVRWRQCGYENRLDVLGDELPDFVEAVLGSIDRDAARSSSELWEIVCRFFGGCVAAARSQYLGIARETERVSCYFDAMFPGARAFGAAMDYGGEGRADGEEGYAEFMDWLSDPAGFHPARLRRLLDPVLRRANPPPQ